MLLKMINKNRNIIKMDVFIINAIRVITVDILVVCLCYVFIYKLNYSLKYSETYVYMIVFLLTALLCVICI